MTNVEGDVGTTWILEQKNGAYRIQADGSRAAKVVMKKDKTVIIPHTCKPIRERVQGGLLTRQISIYAPPQFLVCSPSRDMPLSPVSLPSPTLSYSNLLSAGKEPSTPYYTMSKSNVATVMEYKVVSKEPNNGKQQEVADFKVLREEKGNWGKRKLWVDGRILNSKGNEPLVMLSMALQVLEEAQPNQLN